jgi:hypothetical protein
VWLEQNSGLERCLGTRFERAVGDDATATVNAVDEHFKVRMHATGQNLAITILRVYRKSALAYRPTDMNVAVTFSKVSSCLTCSRRLRIHAIT